MIVTKRKTPKMYIIKFSFLKIFEKFSILAIITSSSILLTFSTNFPLPEPFEMFSRIRDVQVSQSWQGREEKLKLRLSWGIPRRFRPSLRILTTPSPNLEISLRSNASLGYAIENTLVVHERGPIPALDFSDSSRSTIHDEIFRRAVPDW